jgi:hypothetical protein
VEDPEGSDELVKESVSIIRSCRQGPSVDVSRERWEGIQLTKMVFVYCTRMSFKALFCLISHRNGVSMVTFMFVLTIGTCASIRGIQLPNVSFRARMEWLFTAQPSGLLQSVRK